MPTYNIGLLKS